MSMEQKINKGGLCRRSDEWFMKEALKEANKACCKDETPVGAVIVFEGRIIGRGHNEKESKQDPTLHAEMTAIKKACKKMRSWRLIDCDMYVTLEPCAMCAGAIIHSRIRKLFIGADDPKAGAVGSVVNIMTLDKLNHRVEVEYGVLENECSEILKAFFRKLRARKQEQRH